MLDTKGLEPVVGPLEHVAGRELDGVQRVRQPAEERLQPGEQVADALRPVHGQRELGSAAERERLQHPRQAEHVIRVQVGEEDLLDVRQTDGRALQLPLGPFRAVEGEPLAAAAE